MASARTSRKARTRPVEPGPPARRASPVLPSPWIDVAICFDRQIETAALVLLASLRNHANPARPTRVHAVTDGISPRGEEMLADMRNGAFDVDLIKVENAYAKMQSRGYISVGTYLRFVLPEVLASDKVLYLDIDVVVRRELSGLFDVDLGDHAVAAVPDFSQNNSDLTWRPWRIEYEGGAYTFADYAGSVLSVATTGRRPYFNCGVLLLNLDNWRRTNLVERTLDFLRSKPNLRFIDQDALNHIVGTAYVRLDLRWNAFAVHACPVAMHPLDRLSARGRDWQTVRSLWRSDPWILHFAGPNKPWSPADEPTPFDRVWWDNARTLPNFREIRTGYIAACNTAGTGFEKGALT